MSLFLTTYCQKDGKDKNGSSPFLVGVLYLLQQANECSTA